MLHRLCFCCTLLSLAAGVRGAVAWNVSINDTTGRYTALYSTMIQNCRIAGQTWSNKIITSPSASIEVQVNILDVPSNRGGGGSVTHVYVGKKNGINTFEQGAAAELKSGVDPNGADPDIAIELDPDYIDTQLYWDPSASTRTAPIPNNRIDDMSVWLHELGHAIAMNGWKDWTTAILPPGSGQSPFDALVGTVAGNNYFYGPAAQGIYGGIVPLTYGNLFHFGNSLPRPGSSLIPDLMNGVVFNWGTRYYISPLDLAVLQDTGIPVTALPEPEYAMFGVLAITLLARRSPRIL
jgi:hypothetical protein